MKNMLLLIAIMLPLFALAQTDKIFAKVEGLGCPFCANGLEKKFKDIEGLKNFVIALETGAMTFTVPASLQLSVQEVADRVGKAGYTLADINIERASGQADRMNNAMTISYKGANGEETATFTVHGNCGMCKTRIEKAAMGVKGVKKATWDAEKQQIDVQYNTKKTTLKAIHEAIAAVGHDTDLVRAKDEVYDNLHGCCKYERE